jgi:hypothetical protein
MKIPAARADLLVWFPVLIFMLLGYRLLRLSE